MHCLVSYHSSTCSICSQPVLGHLRVGSPVLATSGLLAGFRSYPVDTLQRTRAMHSSFKYDVFAFYAESDRQWTHNVLLPQLALEWGEFENVMT